MEQLSKSVNLKKENGSIAVKKSKIKITDTIMVWGVVIFVVGMVVGLIFLFVKNTISDINYEKNQNLKARNVINLMKETGFTANQEKEIISFFHTIDTSNHKTSDLDTNDKNVRTFWIGNKNNFHTPWIAQFANWGQIQSDISKCSIVILVAEDKVEMGYSLKAFKIFYNISLYSMKYKNKIGSFSISSSYQPRGNGFDFENIDGTMVGRYTVSGQLLPYIQGHPTRKSGIFHLIIYPEPTDIEKQFTIGINQLISEIKSAN